jgi:integrase
MPRKRLTEEGVNRLKPPATGQLDYYDAGMPGLVLRLNYGGSKVWRALYYVPTVAKSGKKAGQRIRMPTTHELGRYPHLKLKEAREAARVFLADPLKAKAQADTGSFKDVAENFIKRHVEANKLRTQADIVRLLNSHIYPHWQHRPFREIRRGDVAELLDKIEDNNGPRQADVCLAIIRKCMNWYATRNDDYSTPIVKGMGRYSAKDHRGDRFLTDDEIRALWKACGEMGTFGALVKTLLLTGQRRDKVATMKWDDVIGGEWTIASEDREKTNAGLLKLPQALLDIIEAQPHIAENPFVFAGRGHGQFNSFSQRSEELNKKLPKNMPAWTLHDLRRTCRKLMSKAGVRPDVAELALGHSIKGIQATYDDPEAYRPMIDEALQSVADRIDRIINPPPEDVAELADARRRKRRT